MYFALKKVISVPALLLFVALAAGSFAYSDVQYIVLEDKNGEPYESDNRFQIDFFVSDQAWDNRAVKACGNGIWLMHDEAWSGETELVKLRNNSCVSLEATAGKVSSLRAVGIHNHKDVATMNSFSQANYTGKMTKFTKDNMKPTDTMASVIIMGPEKWTVSWNDDEGKLESRCLWPVIEDYSDTTEAPDVSVKPYLIPRKPIVQVVRGCKVQGRSFGEVARVWPAAGS